MLFGRELPDCRVAKNLSLDGIGRDTRLSAELRQVEEEALAQDQIVLEGELDEHRKLSPLAVGHHAEAVAGHGHLHPAPAHQRVFIGGMAFLPADDAQYAQMPYEEITKEEYERLMAEFPPIDFSLLFAYEQTDETTAASEVACSSGQCDL